MAERLAPSLFQLAQHATGCSHMLPQLLLWHCSCRQVGGDYATKDLLVLGVRPALTLPARGNAAVDHTIDGVCCGSAGSQRSICFHSRYPPQSVNCKYIPSCGSNATAYLPSGLLQKCRHHLVHMGAPRMHTCTHSTAPRMPAYLLQTLCVVSSLTLHTSQLTSSKLPHTAWEPPPQGHSKWTAASRWSLSRASMSCW